MRHIFDTMIQKYILLFLFLFLFISFPAKGGNVVWHERGDVTYTLQDKVGTVVTKAANLFEDDMKALTGNRCHTSGQGEVAVYQLDLASNKELELLETMQVPLLKFIIRTDAFWIGVRNKRVIIVGSNGRGAAYGLLELSRLSGVSPWKWWGDVMPRKRQRLEIDEQLDKIEAPSVEYRGINMDNTQWSSAAWDKNYLKEQPTDGRLGPAYYHKLFELMLRLRANTISAGWDKKHSDFLDVKGNRELADSFSIVVSAPYQDNAVTLYEHKKPIRVNLLWADDGYGYMLARCNDDVKQPAQGAALYHLSYEGQPHDYLWLCTTQPGLVCSEMQTAYAHGANRLWLVTIHDPKVAAYQLNLFMDMAWNINAVTPTTVQQHLQDWLSMQFGKQVGERLIKPMTNFYKLSAIRRPEFMGWNEAPAQGANALLSTENKVANTEFSAEEFGNELERYLNDYDSLSLSVLKLEDVIPDNLKGSYFAMVEYPIMSSAAMATKILQAQEARLIGRVVSFHNDPDALEPAVRSVMAYRKLKWLISVYNTINEQKWRGLMDMQPRNLPVFDAPLLPDTLSEKEIETYSHQEPITAAFENDKCIVRSGSDFLNGTRGWEELNMLGHSQKAVKIKKGGFITYQFDADEGTAELRLALIPTHGRLGVPMSLSVSVDDGEPDTLQITNALGTETWKQGVLRGQIIVKHGIQLSAGTHYLVVRALNEPIVIDQWMIDYNKDRRFYIFPLR